MLIAYRILLPCTSVKVALFAALSAAWFSSTAAAEESLSIAVLPVASSEAGPAAPQTDAPSLRCEPAGDMPLPLAAVAFSFDGKTLAVGGLGEVVLWDLAEGKLARRIEFGQPGTMVQAVASAGYGRTLVAGQGSPFAWGAVTLLDLQTGKTLVEFREPKGPVNCLALSTDGRRLVAGCGDGAAYVYALDEKKLVATLKDHALPVLSASFSFDGKFLVTGGADAKLQTWDTVEWKPDVPTTVGGEVRHAEIRRSQIPKEGAALHTFAMIVGGREDRSLRVMLDGKAQIWQRKSDYHVVVQPGVPLDCAWLAKGGPKAYVACTDATIKVFVEGDRRFTHTATLRGHSDWVYDLALSRDGARLVSASADGTVKLWSTADEKLLATIVHLAPKTDRWLIVARDGWFAASAPETVRWKMANLSATPEKLAALQNPEAVRQALAGEPPAAPTLP